jgi:hypothetical protein
MRHKLLKKLKKLATALILSVTFSVTFAWSNPTADTQPRHDQIGEPAIFGETNDSNRWIQPVKIDPATLGIVISVNGVGGVSLSLGQTVMASSIPVVIASNQLSTVTPGTAPANAFVVGGQYNTSLPSPTNGQTMSMQLDGSGRLIVVCQSGCSGSGGTSSTDESGFTAATSVGTPMMGAYQSANTTNGLTAGHLGIAQLTQYRALESDLVNNAGTEAAGTAGSASSVVYTIQGVSSMTPVLSTPLINGTNASLKSYSASLNVTTTQTQLIAAVSSKRIKIMSITAIGTNTGAGTLTIEDGSGGTTLYTYMGAIVTAPSPTTSYPSFIFATTAGNALYYTCTTCATVPIIVNITYWVDDSN